MLPNEATGQYRRQIGARKVSQCHHKRWHSQADTAPTSALCQQLVHEGMKITVERSQEMLRCTERSLGRSAGAWMTLAHRDHEVLLVEPARANSSPTSWTPQPGRLYISPILHTVSVRDPLGTLGNSERRWNT